jgi:hypothetical protein
MGSTLTKKSSEQKPQDSKLSFFPKAPATPEELDIPVSMAEDLMLRYIYTKGASSLRELSRSIKLSFALLHTLFQRMRQQQLFEITEDADPYEMKKIGNHIRPLTGIYPRAL